MKNKNITRNVIKDIFGSALRSEINKFTKESKNFNNKLYHYTKFENLEKILKSRKLKLSHYKNLNDEMEIKHAIKLALENIAEYAKSSKYKSFWEFFCEFFYSENIFDFYVCSFSDAHNNKYLWENYASDSQGVCLGFPAEYFKLTYQFKKKNRKLILLEKIHYDESGFNRYINDIVTSVDKKINKHIMSLNNYDDDIYRYLASEVGIFIFPLLPKLKKRLGDNNQKWEEENEWRIYQIAFVKKINSILPSYNRLERPKMGKSSINLGLNDICEIWLGSSCGDKEKNKAKKLIKKYGFKKVAIKQYLQLK